MRNVKRLPKPTSLGNASKWGKALLEKIKECNKAGTKVPRSFYNKYKKPDVRKALEDMYEGLCCYCEGRVGVVEFGHIEHRKPKDKYPQETFDWDNLHLACTTCNTLKGDKYDANYPILDAVKDGPISSHLDYDIYWREAVSKRGETTMEHTQLNRENLREIRKEVLLETIKLISEINRHSNSPAALLKKQQLKEMHKRTFGSLVQWATETYLK